MHQRHVFNIFILFIHKNNHHIILIFCILYSKMHAAFSRAALFGTVRRVFQHINPYGQSSTPLIARMISNARTTTTTFSRAALFGTALFVCSFS
jgi:hypothetical protein